MKKEKVILTPVAIFAIIGGTLAYKAKRTFTHKMYTGPTSTFCTNLTFAIITDEGTQLIYWGTTRNVCPNITFIKPDL
jgi:hypothetical protein